MVIIPRKSHKMPNKNHYFDKMPAFIQKEPEMAKNEFQALCQKI
jgi:hypothetical protein